jgi:hypothetical protein
VRARDGSDGGHILIGGTGRAGTTLMVQYFTALGFDTGYTLEQARRSSQNAARAGLEHSIARTLRVGERLPYVAKSPYFGPNLGQYVESGALTIRHFVVPVRSLAAATQSRRRVSQEAEARTGDGRVPGGLTKAGLDPRRQRAELSRRLYQLIHTLAVHRVPVLLVPFPEFARDEGVLHECLAPLVAEHGVSAEESAAALESVVVRSLISSDDGVEGTQR